MKRVKARKAKSETAVRRDGVLETESRPKSAAAKVLRLPAPCTEVKSRQGRAMYTTVFLRSWTALSLEKSVFLKGGASLMTREAVSAVT
jgi:hypothetical protein